MRKCWVVLLFLVPMWLAMPVAQAQCAGNCGGPASTGCWCDDACFSFNDCCCDYVETCAVPEIQSIFPSAGPTAGNAAITLTGSNLAPGGSLFSSPVVHIAERTCPLQGSSNNSLVCSLPAGEGVNHDVSVELAFSGFGCNPAATLSGVGSEMFAYQAPQITGIVPSPVPSQSGIPLTIIGSNFGLGNASTVSLDGQSCAVTPGHGHGMLQCISPGGVGAQRPLVMTVAGQDSEVFEVSFTAPQLSSLAPHVLPTRGNVTLTLQGQHFGTDIAKVSVMVGAANCPLLEPLSDNQIRCTAPPGVGTGNAVRAIVAGQSSNVLGVDYQAPVIQQVGPAALPTQGATTITLIGQNFGTTGASVSIGGESCPLIESGQDHEMIRCSAPPGQGLDVPILLSVAGQAANSANIDYLPPAISGLSPALLPTAGNEVLTITGSNFGTSGGSVSVAGNLCPIEPGGQNHNSIRCMPPAGVGADLPLLVTVAGQDANPWSVSYRRPLVSGVTPSLLPTEGGRALTITGSDFGAAAASVSVGGALCPLTQADAHDFLVCQSPSGIGLDVPLVVSAGGQGSQAFPVDYEAPVINQISPAVLPTAGQIPLTITGSNFGSSGAVVDFGEGSCPIVGDGQSHDSIVCTAPEGVGRELPVVVRVGGQASAPAFVDYLAPAISSVSPGVLPTVGNITLTIIGTNFGSSGAVVEVGGADCPIHPDGGQGHGQIFCNAPAGVGTDRLVRVSAGGQASNEFAVDYLPPVVSGVEPLLLGTAGSEILTIHGINFGTTAGAVSIDGNSCQIDAGGQTHTQILCSSPPGQGRDLDLLVNVAGQSSDAFALSYAAPLIEQIDPASAPAGGNITITLSGRNFGLSGEVLFADRPCPTLPDEGWAHAQIRCNVPSFESGAEVPVTVNVAGQTSNAVPFSFMPIGPLLTLNKSGSGQGQVLSVPAGIDCPADCEQSSAEFEAGIAVELLATAASNSRFVGWQGACEGQDSCLVQMDDSLQVTAWFDLLPIVFQDRFANEADPEEHEP